MAQGRLIKGVVFDANGTPFKGATVSVEGSTESFVTPESGEFEMTVSPYVKFVVANAEGYLTSRAEIDGSFLVFRLQVDKKYLENKLKAEEEARKAAEREAQAKLKAEEEARKVAEREAQAKLKAEEDARKAAEREAQAKLRAEENARLAAEREAQAKLKAEENARLAAEREAQAKLRAEENARLAAEREAPAKLSAEERARLAAEREAQAKLQAEENARKAAEREAAMNASIERGGDAQSLFSKVKNALVYAPAYQTVDLSIATNGFKLDWDSNVSLRYIYAKRLKPLTVGVGAGLSAFIASDFPYKYKRLYLYLDYYSQFPIPRNLIQVPVFLYLRTNPKMDSGSIKPFFALSAGMNIGVPFKRSIIVTPSNVDLEYQCNFEMCYWFANPEVGIDIPVNGDNAISVSLGCQLQTVPIVEDFSYTIGVGNKFKPLVDLHIGYTF
jgi:hypothetical protein